MANHLTLIAMLITSRSSRPSLRTVSRACKLPQFRTQDRTGRNIWNRYPDFSPAPSLTIAAVAALGFPFDSGRVSQLWWRYGSAFYARRNKTYRFCLVPPTDFPTLARWDYTNIYPLLQKRQRTMKPLGAWPIAAFPVQLRAAPAVWTAAGQFISFCFSFLVPVLHTNIERRSFCWYRKYCSRYSTELLNLSYSTYTCYSRTQPFPVSSFW